MSLGRGRGFYRWTGISPRRPESSIQKIRQAEEELLAAEQKHLGLFDEDSSSEDDVAEAESIVDSVFRNYSRFNDGHEGAEKTLQFLQNAFHSGAAVCLICIGSVKRNDPVWGCSKCYGYFHLLCIQKWARDSIFQQKQAQEDLPSFQKSENITWRCPKCRNEYEQGQIPLKYMCFCKKYQDPEYHQWLVPHSCGDTCNKQLIPECGHCCLLLCHPGPCPPCPKTVQTYCYCRKQGPRHQRCSNKYWSCGSICGKPLACKKHFCMQICHAGNCSPCTKESEQSCKCGKEKRKQPCYNPTWQCRNVCRKAYSCGFHSCQIVCHDGDCGECPLSLKRTCPCGKTSYTLPCTEDVPSCNDTCNKLLDCGFHRCSQKCHKDKCGMCFEIVTKVCRCGQHKKSLPCQKEFLCDTKCRKLKNCSRHTCNRKCCDSVCPPCEKPCGKTLSCGYHKCPFVCHRGKCYPCPLVAEVKCKCGSTVITVPCGRQKRTTPPKCNKPCLVPPDCHHSSREPHNCHFGECPKCQQICDKERENCPHKCPEKCHSNVSSKVKDDVRLVYGNINFEFPRPRRFGTPCPPCTISVPVTCFGGHETTYKPCFEAQPSSCQQPCGRVLKCGNHICRRVCHTVIGAVDELQAGSNCDECHSECMREREPDCVHQCPEPCHPGPCPPCNKNVKVKCHCGVSTLYFHCCDIAGAREETKERLFSCGNECPKSYPCGHKCNSDCHSGDCPGAESCRKKVKLPCKCGRMKKEFTCDKVRDSNLTAVDCDITCEVKKETARREKELITEKKRLEEEKRNREELERFEKKFFGKKKYNKKVQPVKEPSFLNRHWIVFLSAFLGFLAGSALVMKGMILGEPDQHDSN